MLTYQIGFGTGSGFGDTDIGIGAITAAAVLAEMPTHSTPRPLPAWPAWRQSPGSPGTARTQLRPRGTPKARQALYMPAVSAISCNPDLARKYRQLCSAGKPPKVAITAVMRKLLLLANALIAKDKTWAAAVPTRA